MIITIPALNTDNEAAQQAKQLNKQENELFEAEVQGDEAAETRRQEIWTEINAHKEKTGWSYIDGAWAFQHNGATVNVPDNDPFPKFSLIGEID